MDSLGKEFVFIVGLGAYTTENYKEIEFSVQAPFGEMIGSNDAWRIVEKNYPNHPIQLWKIDNEVLQLI